MVFQFFRRIESMVRLVRCFRRGSIIFNMYAFMVFHLLSFFLIFSCFQFQLSLSAAMDFHFHAQFVSVDLPGFSPGCSPLFFGFFCCMLVVSFYFLCFVFYYMCFLDFSLLCFFYFGYLFRNLCEYVFLTDLRVL